MHKPDALTLLLVFMLAMSLAGAASGQLVINRCIGENDVPIYTDRACSMLDSQDYVAPPAEPVLITRPSLLQGCSREIEGLQGQVRAALALKDVNSLSGLYHWAGARDYTADMVMPVLVAVARKPLVEMGLESIELDGVEVPVSLWLDQYKPDRPGETVRTHFSLVMNAGCWWLHG